MALSVWTDQQVIDQLNSGQKYTSSTITYSFAQDWRFDIGSPNGEINGFSPLSAGGQAKAALAIRLWDGLIANTMSNVAPGPYASNISLGMTSSNVGYVQGYGPGTGAVWFNNYYNDYTNGLRDPSVNMHGFAGYIQALGQALGLNLMGNYTEYQTNGPSSYQDSTVYSLMSMYGPNYLDQYYQQPVWHYNTDHGESQVAWADWVGSNGWNYTPQTPMMNDIMAIQAIYGADPTTRTGDTVYGFNCTVNDGTESVFDFTVNWAPILCIYDAGGTDTLDLSGFSAASKIDLSPGSFSDCADMTYNVSIARGVTIENAMGGSGDDSISGNTAGNGLSGGSGADIIDGKGGDDTLTGGSGNDSLIGGAGNDTAVFAADWSGLQAIYNAMTGVMTVTSAADGTDTLNGVERLIDAQGVVKLVSSFMPEPPPVFSIAAGAASVTEGNSGATAYSFTVSLAAASAQNQSIGWRLAFGSGSGQAAASDFSGATSGTVTVDAGSTTKALSVSVIGDTAYEPDEAFSLQLYNVMTGATVASATGTITNDDAQSVAPLTLTGNSLANVLTGAGGNDKISGLFGNDTLSGLGGNDLLIGGPGFDRQSGGAGADTFDFDTTGQASVLTSAGAVVSSDVISDFVSGTDKIDLSTIDASVRLLTNNAFKWIGTAAIGTLLDGELRYQQYDMPGTENDYTMVFGDTDADTAIEFAIKCMGLVTFTANDFIL